MKKILGILGLLIVVCATTGFLRPASFLSPYNLQNLVQWTSLFGILSIGAAFVIISGGIDLSIGSVVCLVGCLLAYFMKQGMSPYIALPLVLGLSAAIGLLHGLLITKLQLQPFVVTLCGLLFYRGFARWLTGDETQGFSSAHDTFRLLATGRVPVPGFEKFSLPTPFFILVGLAVVAAIFLNQTIYGRYLMALGRNERAAKFSGINTDRMKLLAYVICSTTAGIGGVLFALELNSVQPASHGNFYELYAIAAAVLGGCSLRGGEGSITGVVIGAAVMRVLYNSINLLDIPTQLEFAIIGIVILLGVIADEVVKRIVAKRRAMSQAKV